MEGSRPDLIRVPSLVFALETEENNDKRENSRCSVRDLTRVPPEYKSRALPLRQPALLLANI
jgi:hypothetical protein